MKRFMLLTLVLFILVAMLLVACSGQSASPTTNSTIETTDSATIAESASETTDLVSCAASGEETTEIATARLYIEYNATDGDLGVHGAFDDDGWSVLCVYAPNGDQLLGVQPQSQLGDLTMAGIFFESREPELDEFSFDNLVARFPEGEYTVRGQSFDGTILTGAALFTHNIPAEPAITAPTLAEDEESAAEATIPLDNLVVTWEDVTETANGDPVTITSYEVIVTKVDHNDPHGFSRPIYDVHVPAGLNSLSVPAEFLEPGTIYELEVLALEGSGNQTISVGFFKTGG